MHSWFSKSKKNNRDNSSSTNPSGEDNSSSKDSPKQNNRGNQSLLEKNIPTKAPERESQVEQTGNSHRYRNEETKRSFSLEATSKKINMTEISGGKQRGNATYAKKDKVLELKTIMAIPEEKSGIGSLLMMHIAVEADRQGCDSIHIISPAPEAVGFYEHMGAKAGDETQANELEKMYKDAYAEQGTRESLLTKIIDETAIRNYETLHYEENDVVPFIDLPSDRKQEYKKSVKVADLPQDKKDELIDKRIHALATSSTGAMIVTTQDLLQRASASVGKRWKEV
jgi:N-acetylglutamate synthase-like GNAT family acetyltransferase